MIKTNSKQKGNRGERELAALLQAKGHDAHRNYQWATGGMENPDVSLPGVHIEVKRTEKLSLYDAMEQACRDANGKTLPIVAHRRNRKDWVVIMTLSDFMEVYESWQSKI